MSKLESEFKILTKVWFSVLGSLCYSYFVSSRIPKGKYRLLSLLPVVGLFTFLPLSLTTVLPTGVTGLYVTWLCNFKLLLFCFDLGPLSSSPPKSLILFILTACLPIKTQQIENDPSHQNHKSPQNSNPISTKAPKLPLNFPLKALIFAISIPFHDYIKNLSSILMLFYLSCMLYLILDVILGICNFFVQAIFRLELQPPSDEPYLSTSLQDFWGRRWNLMATNALRQTIYKPVRTILGPLLGSQLATSSAVLASFVVSGLMHELIYYYMIRVSPTWEVTCFFVLHGACLVAEIGLKKAFSKNWRLHRAISGPLTLGFVAATGFWLFFPPLVRNGADKRAIKEFKALGEFLMERLKLA